MGHLDSWHGPRKTSSPNYISITVIPCLFFGCHVGRLLPPQIFKVPNENVNEASKSSHLTPRSRCRQGERALGRWLVPSDTGACCLLCTNRPQPAWLFLCPHPNNLAGVTQEFTEDYPSVPPKASFPGAASALRPALCALPTTYPRDPLTPTLSARSQLLPPQHFPVGEGLLGARLAVGPVPREPRRQSPHSTAPGCAARKGTLKPAFVPRAF